MVYYSLCVVFQGAIWAVTASMRDVAETVWAVAASMWDAKQSRGLLKSLCGILKCGMQQPLNLTPTGEDKDEELRRRVRTKNGEKEKDEEVRRRSKTKNKN